MIVDTWTCVKHGGTWSAGEPCYSCTVATKRSATIQPDKPWPREAAQKTGGSTNIETTLGERQAKYNLYGSFEKHASIAQDLQRRMQMEAGWLRLQDDQRQALTTIADKIARMLNGDPTYRDNWHDIVGYAKLVDDRMAREEEKDQ